ncbi:ribbon-helix-helix domain-containing protein [Orenia marismortui]|uniref:ribbon-helix-helix domain-containing protein n=1 Tax=Orenia marismortui TaxID=46469 RepID=UPI000363A09C|nr:ribbon-helix-helix domain-containing protein [Orenia marismortui]
MARPKNKVNREQISTTIDEELMNIVRDISKDTGIPINSLIENAVREKYQK